MAILPYWDINLTSEKEEGIEIRKLIGLAKSTAKEIKHKLNILTLGGLVEKYQSDLLLSENRNKIIKLLIPLFYNNKSKAE
jgi:hypothetical protein